MKTKSRDPKVWQNNFSLPAFFQSSQTSPQSVKRKRQQGKQLEHLQKLALASVAVHRRLVKDPTAFPMFRHRNYLLTEDQIKSFFLNR